MFLSVYYHANNEFASAKMFKCFLIGQIRQIYFFTTSFDSFILIFCLDISFNNYIFLFGFIICLIFVILSLLMVLFDNIFSSCIYWSAGLGWWYNSM